ncbi:MAG: PCMD domain-containing protein [Bacteroidales bacterium]|nr:PCMD domain-containing protein [Bacteroidales bacterium]
MKIRTFKYFILTVLAVLLFSCSRQETNELISRGEGLLSLNLGYDLDPISHVKSEDPVFKINIIDVRNGVTIKQIDDHTTLLSNPIVLRLGTYIVEATNGEDVDAAFESPYYKGRDTVELVEGQTATADITCTLANVKVAVAFSESVLENFSVYDVTVNNTLDSLLFDKENNTKDGYFKATGELHWTIRLVNKDGEEFEVKNSITNVQPREYYRICFDIDGNTSVTDGGASLVITYDSSVNVKDYKVDINLNKSAMPTIIDASGASFNGEVKVPQGVGIIGLLNITAAGKIDKVFLSHSSEDMANMGIPAKINLLDVDGSAYSQYGLSWSGISYGGTSGTIDMRGLLSEHLSLGEHAMKIEIIDLEQQYLCVDAIFNVVPGVEVSVGNVDPWAHFAYLTAQYNTDEVPAGLAVLYKRSIDAEWTTLEEEIVFEGNKFRIKIPGLSPLTSYDVKVVTEKEYDEASVVSFTTEDAPQLPNMNMDEWYQSGDAWFPAPNAASLFWDTANGGTADYGYYPTVREATNVVSGYAAKLSSMKVTVLIITKFAAGNLYTGSFGSVVLSNGGGAIVNFGRPYTGRPTSLHGYVDYRPQIVGEYCASQYQELLSGKNDHGQIFVSLTDWTSPREVNTTSGNFFDPVNDPSVIAYGALTLTENTNGYIEFDIPIEYRDNRKPTYIVLVAAASKYGDYFTGAVGSEMYVDEMSFNFD